MGNASCFRCVRTALAMTAWLLAWSSSMAAGSAGQAGFVQSRGTGFVLDGQPFRVAGVNNHYLTFASQAEVTRVLDDAVALGANVVRIFIQPVIGSPDGATPTIWNRDSQADASNLGTRGVYMMAWDQAAARMVFNDGPKGLQRLDFVLAEAGKRNLKVIVALIDFWGYTGGAQQMSAWYGSSDKYTFFAQDPRTRQNYKDWVRHVLGRTNTVNGRRYVDDPDVFAWELANEPDIHPAPLLRGWLEEMSGFVKELDPRHLVSTGHANMARPMTELVIPTVDFGTWHGYPAYEKISPAEFQGRIDRFCRTAEGAGKPVLLEEFGIKRSDPKQAEAYRSWLEAIRSDSDCAGWVVWRLVSKQDGGDFPGDEHDQFDIRNDGSPTWTVLKDAADALRAGKVEQK